MEVPASLKQTERMSLDLPFLLLATTFFLPNSRSLEAV